MFEVGPLEIILPKNLCHQQQAAQGCVQLGFEYLQGQGLCKLSGQPV